MTAPAPIHKTCWTCDTPKPETAFHWRNRARGVRHSTCKACRCEDERERYAALPYPPGLWKGDARHIPATTPASVVDPADACADPDPMGDGSAWGWVTVATIGALGVLVGLVAWVLV